MGFHLQFTVISNVQTPPAQAQAHDHPAVPSFLGPPLLWCRMWLHRGKLAARGIRGMFSAFFVPQGMLLCCWLMKGRQSAAFYYTVGVPCLADHSCFLQTCLSQYMSTAGDAVIARIVGPPLPGDEVRHIP